MTHLVNRLRFEIACSEEQEAFDVRQNLARVMQEIARDAIDGVCSKYVAEDETIRIETIELDLGRLSRHAIERELPSVIASRFEAALVEQLAGRERSPTRKTVRASRFELFLHVITTGTLPWWEPSEEVDLDAIVRDLAENAPAELRAFLYTAAGDRTMWRRIAYQLRDGSRQALVDLLPELTKALADVEQMLVPTPKERTDRDLRTLTLEALLRAAPDILAAPDDATVVTTVAREVIEGLETSASVAGPAAVPLESRQPARNPRVADTAGSANAVAPVESEVPPDRTPASERHVVRHAGLILLAPFLERFFEICALRDRKQWIDKAAQYMAVHLLHYVCTGEEGRAEHALTLEKVCCGIALDEPIPRDLVLRAEQKTEAHDLLASVIEHWKALKNTSIDGLRATFLTRDGVLTRRGDDWVLRVERKTLDILLDRIPWGYSTVAMPWNNYVIHVEW